MLGGAVSRRRGTAARALATLAAVAAVSGCGGGSSVDAGGFTSKDREAAQAALDSLRTTSVPSALVQATAVAAAVPEVCRIHLESTAPMRFRLFIFWTPAKSTDPVHGAGEAAYTWFDATLASSLVQDAFRLGHARSSLPRDRVLAAHSGDAFSKPGGSCELLSTGDLRLIG